ncbi:Nucleic-acid-binding protein from transposon X-element [Araneus ventricosus]|uniref:Nucleic-acid-binding protein from transposon X-element n=1 Tax=Araneus ventricosus TaxID=182803 RepID=A0A4Y2Q675_ARAVE|nr:Nucleic-acid-binding protein from transposon X-element [Araneus ventricosus]
MNSTPRGGTAPTMASNNDSVSSKITRLHKAVLNSIMAIEERMIRDPRSMNYVIQTARKDMGKWHELISHHPEYYSESSAELITKYNRFLNNQGYPSEYVINDGARTDSDSSATESVTSDISDIDHDMADNVVEIANQTNSEEINNTVKEMSENNPNVSHSIANASNIDNGEHSAMDIDKLNTNTPNTPRVDVNNDDASGSTSASPRTKDIVMPNVPKNPDNRVINNCIVYDMPGEEITAQDDGDDVMVNDAPNNKPNSNINITNENCLQNNEDFQIQNRKRGWTSPQKNANNKKINSDSIPLQNKFSPLANLPTAESTQDQANNVNQGKTPKTSPITLKKPANYRELLRRINEVEKIKCIAKEAGEFLKLHCTTPVDAKKLADYFDKNQNEYFVTSRKTNKPMKVVIKGLPKETDTEDIKEELINKNFRVEKVNQLKKFKTREPLNIFQIHLTLTDNVSEIYKLDTLCYHFISVEEYRSRLHYQCFNCQRWNHGSNGCKLNPRCVVCSENHPSKECPLKGQKSNTPKCANCNGPHTASYRGCPRYPQNIQKSKIQPGKSFANALKSNYENVNKPPPQKTNENDSEISQPPSTVKNNENFPPNNTPINHSEFSDIMAIVAEFRKIFRNMKNIRATVQQLQTAEGAFEKIAILAEALR